MEPDTKEYIDVQHEGKTINLTLKKKQNISPQGLLTEVMRIKDAKRDIVVDSRDLAAIVEISNEGNHSEVKLDFAAPEGGRMQMGMTTWAHRQLAEKINMPVKYYERCNEPEHHPLLARNINEWMATKEQRMLRTLDGSIRAIVSDKFQPIDNWLVAAQAMHKFEEIGLGPDNIDQCYLTPTHMYIRATVPWMEREIAAGDTLRQGIIISNSEVGASAFRCEPFLWRKVCSNGLIAPSALTRVHLGARREAGEIVFSDEVNALELNLVIAKIHNLIERTFDNENFEAWVEQLKTANTTNISSPTEAVDLFAKMYNVKDKTKETILDNFVKEGNATQWGFVNAITATARDADDAGFQMELERIAGQVSVMEEPEFRRKIAPLAVA